MTLPKPACGACRHCGGIKCGSRNGWSGYLCGHWWKYSQSGAIGDDFWKFWRPSFGFPLESDAEHHRFTCCHAGWRQLGRWAHCPWPESDFCHGRGVSAKRNGSGHPVLRWQQWRRDGCDSMETLPAAHDNVSQACTLLTLRWNANSWCPPALPWAAKTSV